MREGALEWTSRFRRAAVAERDADVSQEAGVLCAQEGPAGEALAEFRLGKGEELHEIRKRGVLVRSVEFGEAARSVAIVHRTRLLAEITPEDPVTHLGPQRPRNRTAVLDRVMGDAEVVHELVFRAKRP